LYYTRKYGKESEKTAQNAAQKLFGQPFAVPKYHAKGKSRVRSNSMHQQHTSVVAAAGAGSAPLSAHSCSNLLVTQQMQQATSDPMLNSTLAQLLTSSKFLAFQKSLK